MSVDSRHAVLAHWITQRKSAERDREEAKKERDRWFKRAKLALDHGEVELARAAKDKASEWQETYRKATARVVEIGEHIEAVKNEKVVPNEAEFAAATARAEHAAGEFAKMGIDPRFAALEHPSTAAPTLLEEGDAHAPPPERSAFAEADALLDLPPEALGDAYLADDTAQPPPSVADPYDAPTLPDAPPSPEAGPVSTPDADPGDGAGPDPSEDAP